MSITTRILNSLQTSALDQIQAAGFSSDLGFPRFQRICSRDYHRSESEGFLEVRMALQPGDWVKTESGEIGKVAFISRLTVFVTIISPGEEDRMCAFLESQLTKIDSTSLE